MYCFTSLRMKKILKNEKKKKTERKLVVKKLYNKRKQFGNVNG